MPLLRFGRGNAKLKDIATFSLPAGHTCPGALACLAKANRQTGKITDGKEQTLRCFAASMEWNSAVRQNRWHNLELLKGKTRKEMYELIAASLPDARVVRIHVGGDFYSLEYFQAWCDVAWLRSDTVFYAYTKSIPYWIAHLAWIPANLHLTASEGGKYDALIKQYGLKTAKVVFSLDEAIALGLDVDHDDSHAYNGEESFALLLHGGQPKGTPAAKALSTLRAAGWKGYSKAA